MSRIALAGVLLALLPCTPAALADSTCFGTPERGALQAGRSLPSSGSNLSAYSMVGHALGRTYLHCTVASIVVATYAELAQHEPALRFVYGETGLASGGRFRPHKSHQNGLSVDFFVPVRDHAGHSTPLPTNALNRWGYDIEFTSSGRYNDYRIDFDAIADHLAELRRQATARGVRIAHVFFATELQPYLHRTKAWPAIRDLPFSTKRGWWRHDEHYHVDFSLPCKPLRP